MADSLDGNFILENTFRDFSSPSLGRPKTGKRALDEGLDSDADDEAMKVAAGASSAAKRAKRKVRQKARKARLAEVRKEEEKTQQNPAALPPEFQADWLRREMRRCKAWKKLSEIELDERAIAASHLIDSTSWQDSPRDVVNLTSFLRRYVPNLERLASPQSSPLAKTRGAPAILVLTNNALRAADLTRGLRALFYSAGDGTSPQKGGPKVQLCKFDEQASKECDKAKSMATPPFLHIAKLFSRHFTPVQQSEFLSSHSIVAGAGTAQRIAHLLERGAIDVAYLEVVVLDVSWRDEKARNLMDEEGGREGVKDAWELLKAKKPSLKVLLF